MHNKAMHMLNGNTARIAGGSGRRNAALKQAADRYNEKINGGVEPAAAEVKSLKRKAEEAKKEIIEEHAIEGISWPELWDVINDMKMNDGYAIRCEAMQAVIFCAMDAMNELSSELYDTLLARVAAINDILQIQEPDDRELTPIDPPEPQKKKVTLRPQNKPPVS